MPQATYKPTYTHLLPEFYLRGVNTISILIRGLPEGVNTGRGGGSPGPGTKGGTLARPGVDRGRLPGGGAVQKGAMAVSVGFLVAFLLAFVVTLSFSVLVTYSVASGVAFLVLFLVSKTVSSSSATRLAGLAGMLLEHASWRR